MIMRYSWAVVAAMAMQVGVMAQTQPAGFVNITKECGVGEMVEKNYALEEKLWVSGQTLADLDGDGFLDLLIGGHGYVGAFGHNDGKGHFVWVDPQVDPAVKNQCNDGLSIYDRQ